MSFSWEDKTLVPIGLIDDEEFYERAFAVLRSAHNRIQTEVSNEDLDQTERECKVMLIDLCKDIALEFAEGVKQ